MRWSRVWGSVSACEGDDVNCWAVSGGSRVVGVLKGVIWMGKVVDRRATASV